MFKKASVCTCKTFTRRRFERTHGYVLNLHTVFSACQAALHTTHTPRTHTPQTPHTTHCSPTPAPTLHITTLQSTPQHQNTKRTSHTLSTHTHNTTHDTNTTHTTPHTYTDAPPTTDHDPTLHSIKIWIICNNCNFMRTYCFWNTYCTPFQVLVLLISPVGLPSILWQKRTVVSAFTLPFHPCQPFVSWVCQRGDDCTPQQSDPYFADPARHIPVAIPFIASVSSGSASSLQVSSGAACLYGRRRLQVPSHSMKCWCFTIEGALRVFYSRFVLKYMARDPQVCFWWRYIGIEENH